MSTIRVPQDYPTVQAAVNAAATGDTVVVAASYAATEAVTVSVDGLTIGGTSKAAVTLTLGSGVTTLHLGGTVPFAVVGNDAGDTIFSGGGGNRITGGSGSDRIFGNAHDVILAGKGDDVIFLAGTPAKVDGGDGNDIVRITGNVTFAANSVTNIEQFSVADGVTADFSALGAGVVVRALSASGGTATVRGTAFADTFYSGDGADRFIGGGGGDTVSYNASGAGVTASLATPSTNTGSAAGDTYSGVANLTGSTFNDTLSGDGQANVIDGGKGDDTIYGGKGDTLIGGYGNDTFVINGAVSGAPASIEGDVAGVGFAGLGVNTIHVVGNTAFGHASIADISEIDVANGVTADLSGVDGTGLSATLVSQSVAGGGSTIRAYADPNFSQFSLDFTGGLGADTLIGDDQRVSFFDVFATPALIDGGKGGGTMSVHGAIAVTDTNVKRVQQFFVDKGLSLDLSALSYGGVTIDSRGEKGDGASNFTGTSGKDEILGSGAGGVITGGGGADFLRGAFGDGATTYAYKSTGDTGITANTLDEIAGFDGSTDHVQIQGITGSTATYAEAQISTDTFSDALSKATALMSSGTKTAVFIHGTSQFSFDTNSWLFWNASAGAHAPNQAVQIDNLTSLSDFSAKNLG